jgi:putative transposase
MSDELREEFFLSKNLYNVALYQIRQKFFKHGGNIPYSRLYHMVKDSVDYEALPRKVGQQTIKKVQKNMVAFLEATRAFYKDPSKFNGIPKLPHYKDKENGQFMLVYTKQAIKKKNGFVIPSGLEQVIQTRIEDIREIRLIPKGSKFIAEIVYEVKEKPEKAETYSMSLDMGLNNLVAITSDKEGFKPLLINGRPLKSFNQFYNKTRAYLQSKLPEKVYTTRQLANVTRKRTNKVNDYLHKASRAIINLCLKENISCIVIGKNEGWKQSINIGSKNNQNFVCVPHARFIQMITYKATLEGIKIIVTEESYTSKCSFLDLEEIGKHEDYKGKRVKRGLFKTSKNQRINADVNGSYNILRKVVPNAFSNGIEAVLVQPSQLFVAA